MKQKQMKKTIENVPAKQLNDEELEQVNAGMKIVTKTTPKFIDTILRLIYKIKGK